MLKVNLIVFLIGISPLQVKTAFCTKHGQGGEIIRYCCPGYTGDGENCTPFCSDCQNGVCVRPYVCECNDGFGQSNGPHSPCVRLTTTTSSAQPHSCNERCRNGTCVNGECTCAQGWLLQQHESFDLCAPHCNGACANGYCSAPNTCVCSDGFEPHALNQFACVRRSGSGALWPRSAQLVRTLASLLLISCYCACWTNINALPRCSPKRGHQKSRNK